MKIAESSLYPLHLPKKYRKLVPLKQINLNDEPLSKNIEFMRLLFRANILEAFKKFSRIDEKHYAEQEAFENISTRLSDLVDRVRTKIINYRDHIYIPALNS